MEILYIITQADGGGAQNYVLSLAEHFKGSIAAGLEAKGLFEQAKERGIPTYELKYLKRNLSPFNDFLAALEIRKLIKLLKPDIVHLNSSKAGVLGSFAKIGLDAKLVYTAHGFVFNEPLPYALKMFYLAAEKVASDFRDMIIAVSDADRNSALRYNLIAPEKIITVHNGIRAIDFLPRDEARKQLGLPLDKKIIGAIANDYKTKGLDIFASFKPIQGVIIATMGNTDKKSTENIKYLGYKHQASKFLKAFDVIVLPSRKEGFPFTAIEALQAGSSIVATNAGGLPEALGDAAKITDDREKIEEKVIEAIFEDEEKTKKLRQKALERSKLFTEEKMLEETKKIYRDLLL